MGEGEFVCELRERDEPGSTGGDEAAFLVRPNAGLPFAPVAETASGGELSRIALAIAAVAGGDTLVFDEIDAGIGGETAHAVGGLLQRLAEHAQVVTITHLPQIAALADRHFRVEKTPGDPTHTRIEQLGDDERQGRARADARRTGVPCRGTRLGGRYRRPVEEVWAVLADPAAGPSGGPASWKRRRACGAPSRPARTGTSRARTARASCRPPAARRVVARSSRCVPLKHVSFQLTSEHSEVELDLAPVEDGETQATLAVEAPRFGGMGRTVPSQALAGLAALVRPAAAD